MTKKYEQFFPEMHACIYVICDDHVICNIGLKFRPIIAPAKHFVINQIIRSNIFIFSMHLFSKSFQTWMFINFSEIFKQKKKFLSYKVYFTLYYILHYIKTLFSSSTAQKARRKKNFTWRWKLWRSFPS